MDLQNFEAIAVPHGLLGIKITQHGTLLTHRVWDEECRRNVYSICKGLTACAVGLAQQEGLLRLDEKLVDAFSEDLPDCVCENLAQATVRDLLTMCLGQDKPFLMAAERPLYPTDNWAKLALAQPFPHRPRTHFLYSNVGPYLAGLLVQRRAACNLVDYLLPRLFQPLGIPRPTWEVDPRGNTFGASGLMLTLSELHKLGLLFLQNGEWEGKQLLPADWLTQCTRAQDNPRYGYLFWMEKIGGYRTDGKYGQYNIILPEKDAVLTIVSESRNADLLRQAIVTELYPQL